MIILQEPHGIVSNSNFEKISYLKFNNNTRDMKMEEIKPRYGVIWPGLKGRYILAQGIALGSLYFSI